MEHDEKAVTIDDATARAFHDAWAHIRRVMTLAEGAEWEESLPQDVEFKFARGAEDEAVPMFLFKTGVMYVLEPATGQVVETQPSYDHTDVRVFDSETGVMVEQSTIAHFDPNMN